MSRIGKKPGPVPSGVTATVDGQTVKMKGPKGELSFTVPGADRGREDRRRHRGRSRARRPSWPVACGACRARRSSNLVDGVTKGYSHTLEIHGVGFRAAMKGKDQLQLQIGFSHDVDPQDPGRRRRQGRAAPSRRSSRSPASTSSWSDRWPPNIRASRPPEPYQGKGIRYQGEYIHRKEGKKK